MEDESVGMKNSHDRGRYCGDQLPEPAPTSAALWGDNQSAAECVPNSSSADICSNLLEDPVSTYPGSGPDVFNGQQSYAL